MPFDFIKGIHLTVDTLCEAEVLSSFKCARKYSSLASYSTVVMLNIETLMSEIECSL